MTNKLSRVLHIRALDTVSEEAPTLRPQSGITLAYSISKDGGVTVGFSVCSFKDQFNRTLGKKIAVGRLNSERVPHLRYELDSSALEFIADTQLNIKAKMEPELGKDGEYFVREANFPLTKILLMLSKSMAIELLQAELRHEKMRLIEQVTEEHTTIVRFGKSYAFTFDPDSPKEVEIVV